MRERTPAADRDPVAAPALMPAAAPALTGVRAVLAAQQSAGNRAVAGWLARLVDGDTPQAAAKEARWADAVTLLLRLKMPALLDAASQLEADGELTALSANLSSARSPAEQDRLWAAILAVQGAPADRVMERRLKLPASDAKALDAWLAAHGAPLPVADAAEPPRRAVDGAPFVPSAPDLADAPWAEELLRFFGLGASAEKDPAACVFDGRPSSVPDVAGFVSETALFAKRGLDQAGATPIITRLLAPSQAAQKRGDDIGTHIRAGDWAGVSALLEPLDMATMLDTLEALRAAGTLAPLAQQQLSRRIAAAVLTVAHQLGISWTVLTGQLSEDERAAIRAHVLKRTQAGDIGPAIQPLARKDGQTFQDPPPSTPDAQWVAQFLRFFGLDRDALNAARYRFNDASTTVETITDTVVAQAGLAGRALAPEWTFSEVVKALPAPLPGGASSSPIPRQIVLQYTFVPRTLHEGDKGRSADNPAHQLAGQYTIQFKVPNAGGMELDVSFLVQATFFNDAGKSRLDPSSLSLQNLMAGAQAAWVMPLVTNVLQLQAIVQGVAGAMREPGATGFVSLKPDPTAQVAGQMQVVVTIPGTGDLQFFVQLQRSYTWAPDATKDWSLGLGFQKSFDVTPAPPK
ncbi:MAG TPA: hypothetical protein VI300_25430 [Solirubrobacter sp.]